MSNFISCDYVDVTCTDGENYHFQGENLKIEFATEAIICIRYTESDDNVRTKIERSFNIVKIRKFTFGMFEKGKKNE